MPSPISDALPSFPPSRRIYITFIALVLIFLLSCALAVLTPFALTAAYDMLRPSYFRLLDEFPLNQLEKLLLIPMLLCGASVGATLTHVVRWWLSGAADELWYVGIGPLLKRWSVAGVALPILMFQLRASYPEQPLIASGILALAGGFTGYLIGRRQQEPILGSALSQRVWIGATVVAWGIAWACVPNMIQAYIDHL